MLCLFALYLYTFVFEVWATFTVRAAIATGAYSYVRKAVCCGQNEADTQAMHAGAVQDVALGRNMKKQNQQDEFTTNVENLEEWQNHQYDPYYYTRGRIHPFYKGPQPNKFGYGLIASGLLSVLVTIFMVVPMVQANGFDVYAALSALFVGGLGVLQLLSGIRLLRR